MDLIGSVEFGDWLINECECETTRLQSGEDAVRAAATQRLASLEQAKMLLLEFLTLQDDMMQFARSERSDEAKVAAHQKTSYLA